MWSRDFTHSFTGGRNNWTIHLYAPKGGTWFCWGEYNPYYVSIYSGKITIDGLVSAGGSEISSSHSDEYDSSLFEMHNHMMAIKIA